MASIDKGDIVGILFIGFRKAFDMVETIHYLYIYIKKQQLLLTL